MDNLLDLVEEPGPDVRPANILLHIWIFPTAVYRYILKHVPERYVGVLFMMQGIAHALNSASGQNMGDNQNLLWLLAAAVITGMVGGYVFNYIMAWVLWVSGRWIGGKATFSSFKTVLAWSQIPIISSLIFFFIKFAIFGEELFLSNLEIDNIALSIALVASGILEIILGFWSLFILVKGTALIQSFGFGKSLLNVIFPLVLILVIAISAAIIFYAF